jgi:hypothetical protein
MQPVAMPEMRVCKSSFKKETMQSKSPFHGGSIEYVCGKEVLEA